MVAATISAIWLGLLTSISPCPLAANIAAMSYISRELGSTRRVLLSGFLYSLGRTVAYVLLAAAIVAGITSIPGLSFFLQRYVNQWVGPVLIVVGILLMEWIVLPWSGGGVSSRAGNWMARRGSLGAFLLGALLALAFCPVSAALFFGGLIPLCIEHGSVLSLPSIYGLGTGLPVVLFAVLLAAGASWVGTVYDRIRIIELWARRVTAVIILLVGIHYMLAYTLPALGLETGWGS